VGFSYGPPCLVGGHTWNGSPNNCNNPVLWGDILIGDDRGYRGPWPESRPVRDIDKVTESANPLYLPPRPLPLS
jgi:hypothetical protein